MSQAERDQETAEKVTNLLGQAKALGVPTTRRQARKALQGRGHLMADIKAAEAASKADQ